mmetsp:Transcript_31369/g.46148  ORF Transcript_31369/g.46148 Transcript_31369/m.46148 type:complete len:267 (-) Transcript_31369:705-1505(-)
MNSKVSSFIFASVHARLSHLKNQTPNRKGFRLTRILFTIHSTIHLIQINHLFNNSRTKLLLRLSNHPNIIINIHSSHLIHLSLKPPTRNPCNPAYRASIMEAGLKVGKFLAAHGARGHFSVDFLASKQPESGSWDVYAVEVNLRQGGTTHPQATMALLCGGSICSDGLFRTDDGELRCYVATDCHYSENLKGCTEKSLVDALECTASNPAARKIRWNKADRIGVVFHLFKFISTGRIGFTAIGRTVEESQTLFNDTVKFLDGFRGC